MLCVCRVSAGSLEHAPQWPSSRATFGSNLASKQTTFLQSEQNFSRTMQNDLSAHRIRAHLPEWLSKDLPPSPVEVIATTNKDEGSVPFHGKSGSVLQSADARKGRSMQSFSGMLHQKEWMYHRSGNFCFSSHVNSLCF